MRDKKYSDNDFLRPPKLTTISKEQYQKFHKIRDLHNWTFGDHGLVSKDQKKYIEKWLPYQPKSPQKHHFLTTHPDPYFQLIKPNLSNHTRLYLYPLLGQPLSSLKIDHRWGNHIKNWITKSGGFENVLLDIVKNVVERYQKNGIGDIMVECYRVVDGKILYIYDSWMKGSMQIIQQCERNKTPINIEQFYLSKNQLEELEQGKRSAKKKIERKQIGMGDFCQKLCLLLLNFGVPEIKSRNYQFCEFQYNKANIQEKIKFFKTKYKSRLLTELIEKLWNHQDLVINDIWKLFDSLRQTKRSMSKKKLGYSMMISNSNSNMKKNKNASFFQKSKHQSDEGSIQKNDQENTHQNNIKNSVYSKRPIQENSSSKNNSFQRIGHVTPLHEMINQNGATPKYRTQYNKLRLKENYKSMKLDTSLNSHTKIKEDSFIEKNSCILKEQGFNLKAALIQSISYHSGKQLQEGQFKIMKIIQFLGLTEHVPQNLYEESVIKAFQQLSVLPQWSFQSYPNGAIYFGETIIDKALDEDKKQILIRNGKGLYLFDSMDIYIGEWQNNSMHGEGSYIFKSGQVYRGQLENGLKHGYGKFSYCDKRVYEGYWHMNSKFGMGSVAFPNNVKFFGFFQKGSLTQGVFTKMLKNQVIKTSGCLQNYNWTDDKLNKNLDAKFHSNPKLQKCQLTSYVSQIDQFGNKYIGECLGDKKHGFGIQETKEEIYEGQWKDGEESGEGKIVVKGKFEIQGIWENGVLVQMKI